MCNATTCKHKHKAISQGYIAEPNGNKVIEGRIEFCGVNTFGEFVTGKAGMHDSMLVVFDGRS